MSQGETVQDIQLIDRIETAGRSGAAIYLGTDHAGQPWLLSALDSSQLEDTKAAGSRIEAINALSHPAILRPYRLLQQDHRFWLAHRWVDDARLGIERPQSLDSILGCAVRLTEALQQTHVKGLNHGRLDAQAIGLTADGQLLLAHFSPLAEGSLQQDLTALGQLLQQWLVQLEPAHPQDSGGETALPPRLRHLIHCLQNGDLDDFNSMAEVRDTLEDARIEWRRVRQDGPPPDWFQKHQQPQSLLDATASQKTISGQAAKRTRRLAAAVVVLAVILLLAVLIWLPKEFATDTPGSVKIEPEANEESLPKEEAKPLTQEQLEALLAQRQEAQTVLDEFINLRLELESQEVLQWGEKNFLAAVAAKELGDEPFRRQQFLQAREHYQTGLEQLQLIAEQGQRTLDEAVQAGFEAIDRGDAQGATEAFQLAQLIDPENQLAKLGLQRAESLDEVLALIASAQALEESQAWQAARDKYQQAQSIDPETRGLSESIRRLSGIITDQAFGSAMSRGLAALDQGDLEQARGAFQQAQSLRPGSSGPAEGLQEIQRRLRESGLQLTRERALLLESEERWAEALLEYEAMLAKDPNLALARNGSAKARDRAALDANLERLLEQPSNWWNERGRSMAAAVLVEAEAIEAPGPKLQSQTRELDRQLTLARQKVLVTLVSDNLCQIIVYKIGRLGQFQSTELSLHPGLYTIVGTRNGYRDVRREILVSPEPSAEPVVLTCEDKVAEAL